MSLAENLEKHFREKHQLPDNFAFFRWSCLPEDGEVLYYEVEGGIVSEKFKSGPRRGTWNFSKATQRKVFRITVEDYKRIFCNE